MSFKVKHIRVITPEMESAIRLFLDSLPTPSQIIEISQAGDFTERGIMSVIIIYI
jgi:hypothetical protein